MFKVTQNTEGYFWPVSVKIPQDGGAFRSIDFQIKFKRLTTSQIESKLSDHESGSITEKEFVREIVIGWKGVGSDSDPDFTPENFNALLDCIGVLPAIMNSYRESISGRKIKN